MGRVSSPAISRWSRSPGCYGFRGVLGATDFSVIFCPICFFFFERTHGLMQGSMRPPCLIYLSTSKKARLAFKKKKKGSRLGLPCNIRNALYLPGSKPRRLRVTLLPAPVVATVTSLSFSANTYFNFNTGTVLSVQQCPRFWAFLIAFFLAVSYIQTNEKNIFSTWNPKEEEYFFKTSSQGVERGADEQTYSTVAGPGHRCCGPHLTNGVRGQTQNAFRIGRIEIQGSLEYDTVR